MRQYSSHSPQAFAWGYLAVILGTVSTGSGALVGRGPKLKLGERRYPDSVKTFDVAHHGSV